MIPATPSPPMSPLPDLGALFMESDEDLRSEWGHLHFP
jgi:hypothetical protein